MSYRVATTSVEGFVQQVACAYLRHGYWFYVAGQIPPGKDPAAVDAKLMAKYGIAVSEATRIRRKRVGIANLQLIRHERFFVILATKGKHPFFEQEQARIRDIRITPIRYQGYAISYRRGGRTRTGETDYRWHSHVAIDRPVYLDLRAKVMDCAAHRGASALALWFYQLPFERYAPVRRQMLLLLRRANEIRKRAGFEPVPKDVLSLRRRIVRPFAEQMEVAVGAP